MSTSDFSTFPEVRRWFNHKLRDVAAAAGILNYRNQPSVINLVSAIVFASLADFDRTIEIVRQLYEMGEGERQAHIHRINRRRGTARPFTEYPVLPEEYEVNHE